ncbi:MAG: aldo/keto reductase [Burkholderiaceae bacterium]
MNKTVALPTGERVPALGLGTWQMGESPASRDAEVAAVRFAIECGYRLFDTAEMYGEGGAETVLGSALADALRTNAVRRDEVFIVSKVYPHNADRAGVPGACDRSRKRLGLDAIDLYLLHWRGAVPLAETVDAFEALKAGGAIREWGVSNFDLDDLIELEAIHKPTLTAKPGKLRCATNQIYYALDERGAEFSLLTYQQTLHMPTMAYCPLGRGSLATDAALQSIASARGASAAQVALAWVMRHGDVIAIPKAVNHDHLEDNLGAVDLVLTDVELKAIDAAFTPPDRKMPLAMV